MGILDSFKIQKYLNPYIWENYKSDNFDEIKLKGTLRADILKIAKLFIESFNIEGIEIDDILFVGSLANYNWSDYSDVDIHVVLNKSQFDGDDDIIQELFDAKRAIFNDKHEISIKGYDVELYAQDTNEILDATGIYSVLYAKWIKTPPKLNTSFNKKVIIDKVKSFNYTLKAIENMEDIDKKIETIDKLKDKIKKYRKSGLHKGGEYSNENLVFKYLRRSGYMEKLSDLKNSLIDKQLTIENNTFSKK